MCVVQFQRLEARTVSSFGEGGQLKMLYDVRQRPQSVYLNGKVHIVFNGGALLKESSKGKIETSPVAVTYQPEHPTGHAP